MVVHLTGKDFTVVSQKALELGQILTNENTSDDEIDEKSTSTSFIICKILK